MYKKAYLSALIVIALPFSPSTLLLQIVLCYTLKNSFPIFPFTPYVHNRMFLSRDYRFIVAPRKFNGLETNISRGLVC